MSTSGNLKGEKNVDFDNFMMIAYILRVNFVGKKFFYHLGKFPHIVS